MIWLQLFLNILISGFVGTSCFDEKFLAETVVSVSQFMKKIWLDFLSNFNRFDFLVFYFFCFMVLFQDNYKLVEECFVWWVVGWHLSGFPLRVVSGILPAMFFSWLLDCLFKEIWL